MVKRTINVSAGVKPASDFEDDEAANRAVNRAGVVENAVFRDPDAFDNANEQLCYRGDRFGDFWSRLAEEQGRSVKMARMFYGETPVRVAYRPQRISP